MAAEISSPAAGNNSVVEAAAAALASLIVAPIFAKCGAAAATTSGFTTRNDTASPGSITTPARPALAARVVGADSIEDPGTPMCVWKRFALCADYLRGAGYEPTSLRPPCEHSGSD